MALLSNRDPADDTKIKATTHKHTQRKFITSHKQTNKQTNKQAHSHTLWGVEHRHLAQRRLLAEFVSHVVLEHLELRHVDRDVIVLRGDEDLEGAEVARVGVQSLHYSHCHRHSHTNKISDKMDGQQQRF